MELLIHNARYEKEFNVQKVETSGDKWRDQVFSALVRKQFDNLERLIGDTAAANIFFFIKYLFRQEVSSKTIS